MQKKLIRNDLILVAAIVVLALISFVLFKSIQKKGNRITVTVDGNTVAEYSLNTDAKEQISTEYGKNFLIIKDGKAYISQADCPDKICVHHRPISKTGETIVCLPHKLVVAVDGK